MDYKLSAPIGKTASADYGRFNYPAGPGRARRQYASSGLASVQNAALDQAGEHQVTQVPVAPLLLGASWAEFSTRDYTGWPSASNAVHGPGPNIPEILYTITQLKPVVLRRGNRAELQRRSPAWPFRRAGLPPTLPTAGASGRAAAAAGCRQLAGPPPVLSLDADRALLARLSLARRSPC